jgi:regulator of sigma E protease
VLITIAAFLGVLAVVIIAHELGHFFTAKSFGVKVEEFGLGFPPRLLGIRRGETLYSLNAIPLGGFTRMAGEEDPEVERSLASKGVGTRLLVLSAGSIMNLILPLLLFSIAYMIPHPVITEQVIVTEVAPGSPAAIAGIESGDEFVSINGELVDNIDDLERLIQSNLDKEITILVKHSDSTTENIKVIPRREPPEDEGALGVGVRMAIISQRFPFWEAIPLGAKEYTQTFVLFKEGIIGMITGMVPVDVVGPVGIAQLAGEAARAGISLLVRLAAIFSISIAILNLLPLPALDGGRITFVLLEWVRRGKRISPKKEGLVHLIGFAMLMGLILAITYQDIMRIISGESLIP